MTTRARMEEEEGTMRRIIEKKKYKCNTTSPEQHSITTRHEEQNDLLIKPTLNTIVEPLGRGGIYAILYSPFMGCHANALCSLFVHGRRLPVRALYIVSFVPKLPNS